MEEIILTTKEEIKEAIDEASKELADVRYSIEYYEKKIGLRKFRGMPQIDEDLADLKLLKDYREELKNSIAMYKAEYYKGVNYQLYYYYKVRRTKRKKERKNEKIFESAIFAE